MKEQDESPQGDATGDGDGYAMERAVSLAVVKVDHAPVVQAVVDGVNVAAAAVAIVNPAAGLIIQTVAATGGWVWNKWKYDRVSPVLLEITRRVQGIEGDYVRREEFADLLWDALRRIADHPDASRREFLRNVLLKIVSDPKDHTENRMFLRLADELSSVELRVLMAVEGQIQAHEDLLATNKVLANRAGVNDDQIDRFMSYLAMERLFDGFKFMLKAPRSGLDFLLTPIGAEFLRYLKG